MSNETLYLVYQVGCIECGVSSYPIVAKKTYDEALLDAENHPSTWDSEGGDGFVQIIDVNTLEIVKDNITPTH